MEGFKFGMKQLLRINTTDVVATVVGLAQYAEGDRSYLLRWEDKIGCVRSEWWDEKDLSQA